MYPLAELKDYGWRSIDAAYLGVKGRIKILIYGFSEAIALVDMNISLQKNNSLSGKEELKKFRISAIFISYFVIEIILIPIILAVLIFLGFIETKAIGSYLENKNFLLFLGIPIQIVLATYFFREIKRAKINFQQITGSFKKINFKLPLILAIANYCFAIGSSTMVLYGLSFAVPEYIEGQVNQIYATTPLGYAFFAIAVLIFAPIMEELFFRGIIFQKLAVQKSTVKALIWSAIIFALIHFRTDLISLFTFGVTLGILYLRTKQIIVPIFCHFIYNLIVTIQLIYWYFFSNVDHSQTITLVEFRQEFIDNVHWYILLVTVSFPYICYYIYQNFPRNNNIQRLPYFTNQRLVNK